MASGQDPTNSYGPFTDALTGPLNGQQQKAPQNFGYGGRAASLALFANAFLTGAQEAQRTKYERSEQAKAEAHKNFNALHAHIQASNDISPEGKKKAEALYNEALGTQLKEGVSKADKESQKNNPLIQLAKGIGIAMAGPGENKKHQDYGQALNGLIQISRDYKIDPNAIGAQSAQDLTKQLNTMAQGQPGVAGQAIPGIPGAGAAKEVGGGAPPEIGVSNTTQGAPTPLPGVELPGGVQPQDVNAETVGLNPKISAINSRMISQGQPGLAENPYTAGIIGAVPKTGGMTALGAPFTVTEKGPDGIEKQVTKRQFKDASGNIVTQTLGEAKKASNLGRPVNIGEAVTISDAKATGNQYEDALNPGHYIDLDSLPPNMELKGVGTNSGLKFMAYSPSSRTIRAGGRVYEVSSRQAQDLASGAGVDLGPVSGGTTSTHEGIVVDAAGNTIAVPLQNTSRPNAPGISGRQNGAQPIAIPNQTAPIQKRLPPPNLKPTQNAVPQTRQTGGNSTASTVQGRELPGMQAGERNIQLQRLVPVRAAATQMFGDPSQPETKSLVDYAHLADDPIARDKLKNALTIAMNKVHQSQNAAGGVSEWIKNVSGAQASIEASRAEVLQGAMQDLKNIPGALEAFNATLAAFSTAVGLRSVSKAAGSQSSVATIERDLPLIGVNTTGSKDFYDKLSHYAQEINDGTKGLGKQVFEGQEGDYFKGGIQKKVADLKRHAPDPSIKEFTNKSGTKIHVGGTVTGPDGKKYTVKGISEAGDIITN